MSLAFNSNATNQDLVSEVLKICGATTAVYPVNDITRRMNMALDRFSYLAITSDGTWQFDDKNFTDMPIGTANLVSGQYDYTFADDVLTVEKVLIKDTAGDWVELEHIDISDSDDADDLWQFDSSNTGTPDSYELFGSSIFLDPKPNYNSTGGLKVVFKRACHPFTAADTTATAGIPSIFDMYLCRYTALPFLIEKNLPQVGAVAQQIQIDEKAIKDFFSYRSTTKDKKPRFRTYKEDNR